ncbi:hypothetical protein KGF56_004689 [Candida oxycetoniae]|uniref:Ubiquitin-like protease family profile domain-containing protein n=1 Tax=Candida oxycetoniae TaxID=497107 RepID=A0AAI9ST74_9ASCO|nr:uncharacterized protein KGF56_004689 [Candida oxycetoniae]KAI3402597.2 hypothetical protein KGF56_004689 [Candida oxycetoniae]
MINHAFENKEITTKKKLSKSPRNGGFHPTDTLLSSPLSKPSPMSNPIRVEKSSTDVSQVLQDSKQNRLRLDSLTHYKPHHSLADSTKHTYFPKRNRDKNLDSQEIIESRDSLLLLAKKTRGKISEVRDCSGRYLNLNEHRLREPPRVCQSLRSYEYSGKPLAQRYRGPGIALAVSSNGRFIYICKDQQPVDDFVVDIDKHLKQFVFRSDSFAMKLNDRFEYITAIHDGTVVKFRDYFKEYPNPKVQFGIFAEENRSKEPVAVPSISKKLVAVPSISKEPVAVPSISKEPVAVPSISKEPIAVPSISKEPIAVPSISKEPVAVPSISKAPKVIDPLKNVVVRSALRRSCRVLPTEKSVRSEKSVERKDSVEKREPFEKKESVERKQFVELEKPANKLEKNSKTSRKAEFDGDDVQLIEANGNDYAKFFNNVNHVGPEVVPSFHPELRFKFNDGTEMFINRKDFETLFHNNWVNDLLIDFGLKYSIQKSIEEGKVKSNEIYAFNSFFYTKLVSKEKEGPQDYYGNIRRWLQKIDLMSYPYVVIPINEDLHWYCCIVRNLPALLKAEKENKARVEADSDVEEVDPKVKSTADIFVFDSLGMRRDHVKVPLKQFIIGYCKEKYDLDIAKDHIRVHSARVPRQRNFNDCGVHVLFNVRKWLNRIPECEAHWRKFQPGTVKHLFPAEERNRERIFWVETLLQLHSEQDYRAEHSSDEESDDDIEILEDNRTSSSRRNKLHGDVGQRETMKKSTSQKDKSESITNDNVLSVAKEDVPESTSVKKKETESFKSGDEIVIPNSLKVEVDEFREKLSKTEQMEEKEEEKKEKKKEKIDKESTRSATSNNDIYEVCEEKVGKDLLTGKKLNTKNSYSELIEVTEERIKVDGDGFSSPPSPPSSSSSSSTLTKSTSSKDGKQTNKSSNGYIKDSEGKVKNSSLPQNFYDSFNQLNSSDDRFSVASVASASKLARENGVKINTESSVNACVEANDMSRWPKLSDVLEMKAATIDPFGNTSQSNAPSIVKKSKIERFLVPAKEEDENVGGARGDESVSNEARARGDESASNEARARGDESASKESRAGGDESASKESRAGGDESASKESRAGGDESASKESRAGGDESASKESRAGGDESASKDGKVFDINESFENKTKTSPLKRKRGNKIIKMNCFDIESDTNSNVEEIIDLSRDVSSEKNKDEKRTSSHSNFSKRRRLL